MPPRFRRTSPRASSRTSAPRPIRARGQSSLRSLTFRNAAGPVRRTDPWTDHLWSLAKGPPAKRWPLPASLRSFRSRLGSAPMRVVGVKLPSSSVFEAHDAGAGSSCEGARGGVPLITSAAELERAQSQCRRTRVRTSSYAWRRAGRAPGTLCDSATARTSGPHLKTTVPHAEPSRATGRSSTLAPRRLRGSAVIPSAWRPPG